MISLSNIGRMLLLLGMLLGVTGGLLIFLDWIGIEKWKIPGDIRIEWGSFSCVIALGSSILLSLLITLVLNFLIRILNR